MATVPSGAVRQHIPIRAARDTITHRPIFSRIRGFLHVLTHYGEQDSGEDEPLRDELSFHNGVRYNRGLCTKSMWAFWVFMIAFIVAMATVLAAMVRRVTADAPIPPFWERLGGQTGNVSPVATYFGFFFGVAVLISLLAHTIFAIERRVRRIALLGSMFVFYYCLTLAFTGSDLSSPNAAITCLRQLATHAMLYSFIAKCCRGRALWLIAQLTLTTALFIALAVASPQFRTNASELDGLLATDWRYTLFCFYYGLGGIIRFSALLDCGLRLARSVQDKVAYTALLCVHIGLYYAVFAVRTIYLNASGPEERAVALNNAVLLLFISIIFQYAVTPLLLTHFVALGHAQLRAIAHYKEIADKRIAVADAAAASRQEFLRYVFHEVRVPFNTIVLGLNDLASRRELSEFTDVQDDLRIMQQAGQGMKRIMDDTLELERLSSGRYALSRTPTNIREVVGTLMRGMATQAKELRVNLSAEVDERVPAWVLLDPHRITQVLANFLSNALKFVNHEGTGTVRLVVRVEEAQPQLHSPPGSSATVPAHSARSWRRACFWRGAIRPPRWRRPTGAGSSSSLSDVTVMVDDTVHHAGQWLRFEVTDNGVGIGDADLARLWRPFTQIDAGTLQKGKGTGLGLHISKEIVRYHGGNVGAESELGKGSTFYAQVPLLVATQSPSKSAYRAPFHDSPGAETKLEIEKGNAAAYRVLIVDDVAANRLFLRRAIQRAVSCALIEEATNGKEAVNRVVEQANTFHLIAMDKEMPVMNGYEAVQKIRQHGYGGLIVGVTANALEADQEEFRRQGVDCVLTKPVDVNALTNLLKTSVTTSPMVAHADVHGAHTRALFASGPINISNGGDDSGVGAVKMVSIGAARCDVIARDSKTVLPEPK